MSFMFSRRNGIIFDLDNTLIPTSKCYEDLMTSVPEMLSQKLELDIETTKNIMSSYNNLSSVDEPFWKQNKFKFFEWREYILEKSVKLCTREQVNITELHNYFQTVFLKNMYFSDELKDLLVHLREQFKLAILTNGDSQLQRTKLGNCEAEKYFDAIVVCHDYKMMKPDPRIFHTVCRKIGLEHHQCIMIGDLLSTDILGSQRAGLKGSIYVKGRDIEKLGEINPDQTIESILDLKNVLNKFNWKR